MTLHKSAMATTLLAALAITTLSGCGTSDGPFDSREDAIEAVAERLNSGDRDSVCAIVSNEAEDAAATEGSDAWKDCTNDLAGLPRELDLDPTGYSIVDDNERQLEVSWGQVEAGTVPVGDGKWLIDYVDLD